MPDEFPVVHPLDQRSYKTVCTIYNCTPETARRIVACVNALAGVPDRIVESGAMRELFNELAMDAGGSPETIILEGHIKFGKPPDGEK
jgi:hypothetical protein